MRKSGKAKQLTKRITVRLPEELLKRSHRLATIWSEMRTTYNDLSDVTREALKRLCDEWRV